MKVKFFFIILALFTLQAYAQETETILSEESIFSEIDKIKKLNENVIIDRLEAVDAQTLKYLKMKDKECSGEFKSIVINELGQQVVQKKKLSKSEKKLCKFMLVSFRIKYNEKVFEIKKEYLNRIHQAQLKDLDKLRQKTLSRLEKIADKLK